MSTTTVKTVDLEKIAADYKKAYENVKRRIIICGGTGCVANGSLDVRDALAKELEKAGIDVTLEVKTEDTKKDETYISKSGCQGFCQMGPLLHIEPGECALYGGVWFPQSDVLRVLRRSVYDNMDELQEIISRPEFREVFSQLEGDRLKTMPRGYPADAPHAELLKLKEYLVSCRYDDRLFERPDWQDTVAGHIRLLQPFTEFFNFTFDEMHS